MPIVHRAVSFQHPAVTVVRRPWQQPLGQTESLGLLCAAVALGYALYTQQAWEDFFITFRHSCNLCEGNGLVYNPGERVHGFTSPLGVLLPALCYLVTGKTSWLGALWLFRVVSIAAFAAGGWFLGRACAGTG